MAELGARTLWGDSSEVESVSALRQPGTWNEQGKCPRSGTAGRGDSLGPESPALRIIQVKGVGRIGRLRRKIDQKHGALLAIRPDDRRLDPAGSHVH